MEYKQLLELGLDISYITKKVYDNMSVNKFILTKIVLNSIEIIDCKIAYVFMSKQDLDQYAQGEENIHEGFVNYGRCIENVEVSIFIRQVDDNKYKLSLRSNEYVDVAKVAASLNGGGHVRAAGASLEGNIQDLKNMIIELIKKEL